MKKNKIYIKNKKSLFSLFIALFLTLNFANAQNDDVDVIVTNFIYNSITGSGTTNGNIRIEKNYTGDLVIGVFPPQPFCSMVSSVTILEDDVDNFHNFSVTEDCVGEWCFTLTNPADPSCVIKFCEVVSVCEEVWKAEPGDKFKYIGLECKFIILNDGNLNNLVSDKSDLEPQSNLQKEKNHKLVSEDYIQNIEVSKIFPNPFSEKFTIDISSSQLSEITIEVVNLLGKSVLNQQSNISIGKNSITIDLNADDLGGSYFIRLYDSDGFFHSEKLIHLK